MSRPRFLADNDLTDHIVRGVKQREPAIEFLHVRDLGMEKLPDPEVLAFAAVENLLVVSHDVNSMSAAAAAQVAAGEPMHGLLLVHQGNPVRSSIESLILIWAASEAEEWIDQIRFLPL